MDAHVVSAVEARAAVPTRRFGERARARLRIAAVLLRRTPPALDADSDAAYAALLRDIEAMKPRQRERLRAHVDWVEAYENEESRLARAQPQRRPPSGR